MLLNSEQMKAMTLIGGADDKAYRETSYYLQIGEILPAPREGASATDIEVSQNGFYLLPQGLVKVVSKEIIKLPRGVTGYALVRNSLSNAGVMAINIGMIDPGYDGPISSTLINFGKNPVLLTPKMSFLRLTFHDYTMTSIQPADTIKSITKEAYVLQTRNEVDAHLSSSFLNLEQTAENAGRVAFGRFKEWLIFWAAALAVILAILTILVPLGAAYADRYFLKSGELERRIVEVEKTIKDLSVKQAPQPPVQASQPPVNTGTTKEPTHTRSKDTK
jgi:deoxycytidine triphosphate deaminase